MSSAIVVDGLRKSYGRVVALDGLDVVVEEGTVHALLGPNGSGKTTTAKILATLLHPDGGRAAVCGHDVVREPAKVRSAIALTGQNVAIEELLTGYENLMLFGRLRGLSTGSARARAQQLVAMFELDEVARRPARTYSGGLARRLDLALSLMVRPRVLFLDEPTSGLDPRARFATWGFIERIARDEGSAVLLSTHDLDEADRLAAVVTVVDRGRALITGSPASVKQQARGARVDVVVVDGASLDAAAAIVRGVSVEDVVTDAEALMVTARVADAVGLMPSLLRAFEEAGVRLTDLAIRRPSLDDAFLELTGRHADDQSVRSGRQRKRNPEPELVA